MNFRQLLSQIDSGDPERQQGRAKQRFPEEVRRHSMRFWRPGDSISTSGVRFLIGVAASYSVPDLELMDQLVEGISQGSLNPAAVDVFDMSGIQEMQEFESYIPGISPVAVSPVLGVWLDGQLQSCFQGFRARERLLSELSDFEERA